MNTWQPISTAPRNASKFRAKMKDGTIHEDVHWACDLSGDEQPPFKGFFIPIGNPCNYYNGIEEPEFWMEIKK